MMESFVGKAASESRIDKVDDATWTRLTATPVIRSAAT